jgi:hypothetical protein
MSDNRPVAYEENGVSIYRASGTGSCLTALVAAKMGYEEARSGYAGKILSDAAREGNLHEGAVVDTLMNEYGWRWRGGQDLMEMKVIPKVIIRGHVDGFAIPKGMKNERVLEVKTMSRDRFKKWMGLGDDARQRLLTDEFMSYAWQISSYMWHYGMSAMYVVKNRDSGKLDISEIKIPPIDKKTMRKKIIEAEMWVKRGELPPCANSSGDQFFCPYPYLHNGDSKFGDEPDDEQSPLDDATSEMIVSMAEHYVDLAKRVKTMKPIDDERKDIGGKLMDLIGREGPKKTELGGYVIGRVDKTYPYVDKVGLVQELNDLSYPESPFTIESYEALLEKHKKKKPTPYMTVKYLGDK